MDPAGQSFPVSHIENGGKILLYELTMRKDGKFFSISVATPDYIEKIKQGNLSLSPDLQEKENLYPLENLASFEDVLSRLSQIPYSELEPYAEVIEEEQIEQ